jgi:hypothetical protein
MRKFFESCFLMLLKKYFNLSLFRIHEESKMP